MSERDLAGRVAVVTGASQGIGAATARLLARRGARVALVARSREPLEALVAEIGLAGGEALAVPADVSRPDEVRRAFAAVEQGLGPCEILINNAALLVACPFERLTPAEWERMWTVNVTGVLLCAQAALAHMRPRRAGDPWRRGVIVNVASVSGVSGVEKLPGLVGYAATKGAVVALSEALAAEVGPSGVRVMCVSPGSVKTPMLARVAPAAMAQAMEPEEVAEVLAFLAGDASAAVTRTNLLVWGAPGAG